MLNQATSWQLQCFQRSPVFPLQRATLPVLAATSLQFSAARRRTFLERPRVPTFSLARPRLVDIHLHAAVGHGHGVVGQGVAGHLAVIGAAGGDEGAHMAGAEGVSLT